MQTLLSHTLQTQVKDLRDRERDSQWYLGVQ